MKVWVEKNGERMEDKEKECVWIQGYTNASAAQPLGNTEPLHMSSLALGRAAVRTFQCW